VTALQGVVLGAAAAVALVAPAVSRMLLSARKRDGESGGRR
jgi:hypothetical protein